MLCQFNFPFSLTSRLTSTLWVLTEKKLENILSSVSCEAVVGYWSETPKSGSKVGLRKVPGLWKKNTLEQEFSQQSKKTTVASQEGL